MACFQIIAMPQIQLPLYLGHLIDQSIVKVALRIRFKTYLYDKQTNKRQHGIYYIIRCSRMWRHSHCPSPPSFFLFRHFDSKNCNLTNVNTNIKTSANLPYLFITACFGSYRSREGVMGAFPHPTFSCARPLFPFVLSLKSFVLPLLSYDS